MKKGIRLPSALAGALKLLQTGVLLALVLSFRVSAQETAGAQYDNFSLGNRNEQFVPVQ